MSSWRRHILILLGVIGLCQGRALGDPPLTLTLTLGEALERANDRPAMRVLEDRARAAQSAANAEWYQALLPTVGFRGSWTLQESDLYVRTLFGNLPFGETSWPEAGIEVTQPLLDATRLFFSAPAAECDADAALRLAAWHRQELLVETAEAFIQILILDAQLDATRSFVDFLRRQQHEMVELQAVGRVIEAEVMEVDVALEQARHELDSLTRLRQVASFNLGRTVGFDGPVEPLIQEMVLPDIPGDTEQAIRSAIANRDDLAMLDLRLQAVEQRRDAVWGELIPRIQAQGRWVWSKREVFAPDEWFEGTLQLVWVPFAALTRVARSDALEAEYAALLSEQQEVRSGVALQVRQALVEYETARDDIDVQQRAVEQARERLRTAEQLVAEDLATPVDLVQAQAALRESQTRFEVARLNTVLAWFRLRLVLGEPLLMTAADPE